MRDADHYGSNEETTIELLGQRLGERVSPYECQRKKGAGKGAFSTLVRKITDDNT